MINFGEELVYWYLRLNGFFMIENFVLHQYERNRNADADILAVRLPNTYEEINGGILEDDDKNLFNRINKNKTIYLIGEVKTGQNNKPSIFYNPKRMKKALQRLGIVGDVKPYDGDVKEINENQQVAKILFSSKKRRKTEGKFINIELKDVDNFIRKRIKKYLNPKYASRLFFPSDLMQYIIWSVKNEEGEHAP
jgi:hypothetical protein